MVKELRSIIQKTLAKFWDQTFDGTLSSTLGMLVFLKSKTIEFHGLGWVSMYGVWVASAGKFTSKKEMGKKFMLSLEEELGYEIIIIKLEEVWGEGGGGN
jgi:hypothetical protein